VANWDLIVVGAGSAGAALAARSAERGRRVLVVEAGPDYRSADMPETLRSPGDGYMLKLDEWSEMLWTDLLATRTATQSPQLYLRGRGVGGSSSVNGQIAVRPPREDFDEWAVAGWSWDEVLPYFCRLETDVDYGSEPYHGDTGPIPVWRMARSDWGSVDEAMACAAIASGFSWAGDVNAPGATGVSPYPINSRDLRRVSTNDAYLEPARGSASLSIRGDALVDRILFEGTRAVGVEIVEAGGRRREHADEIVLSAGAIHSPAILMRSGIGPEARLSALGIDVVVDLPVGQSLQDHPMLCVVLPLRPDNAVKTLDDRSTNCCVRFDSGDPDGSFNDLMLISVNWSDPTGSSWPYMPTVNEHDPDIRGAGMIGIWLNATYSCGALRIASRDPRMQPVVEERMLSDERDLRRLRHGARVLAELIERDTVVDICRIHPREANAALWDTLDNDGALNKALLDAVVDTMHATSTCPMGDVVDSELRVLGAQQLRVADASILPSVPRANTNLVSIAIGERLADRLD
jgi:choline dehydrogenase-like flavoprotein